jgi:toluene monooxygenase system ferredoxin subunit
VFTRVCSLDDLWEGDMEAFEVGGKEILVVHADGGDLYAVQGICPHQEIPLEEGTLKAKTLTCRAHLWQFDVATGNGINPEDCRLAVFPVELRGDDVFVDADAAEPYFAPA